MLRTLVLCFYTALVSSFPVIDRKPSIDTKKPKRCLFQLRKNISCRVSPWRLFVGRRPLSASEREQRDEERRRQERASDVVIGKTSAIRGQSDYALDVAATEEAYLRQASQVEQEIYRKTEQGMYHLKMLQVEEASRSFDRVFELRPKAYLWQAGIAKYYLNELQDAANIFAQSAAVFESRFGEPATEERIWKSACELKLTTSIPKQELKRLLQEQVEGSVALQLARVPDSNNSSTFLQSERRKVLRFARELFDATVQNDKIALILSRARLRSIAGVYNNSTRDGPVNFVLDRKMWKLNAWFYLGLHYDAIGHAKESKNCMKMALRQCPSAGNARDIIHTLPMLHMARRDWFDDDHDFESNLFQDPNQEYSKIETLAESKAGPAENKGFLPAKKKSTTTTGNRWPNDEGDSVFFDTLKSGIEEFIVEELREELQVRGISAVGSKEQLRDKLLDSLLREGGFHRPLG